MKKTLKHTKIFVVISIVLSCLSFATTQKGWSEIYPFYFWKLYSQPAGWAKHYTSYRVYVQDSTGSWIRLENKDRATFNKDETLYFLNAITQRLIGEQTEQERSKDLKKLKIFCEYLAPGFQDYKVVAEEYNPLDLIENIQDYDTTTVVQIP